ncbi:MAG TPA: NlpC/P60 family protein [Amycolatopsis sp.]|uniref:C40 family peptidase n=1 Tax=Amycolatopsis sp. TaxID=37632 RepID=UPI002B4779C7|nr:NlpC/P60 family protein [Amycolatopsis sp.]HKS48997.1 NlpC/P60 family protein [Amycolatopsis sp.]
MQSQPLKRVVAGALAATAVIVAVGFPQATALPAPLLDNPPTNSSDALAQYRQLSQQAEQLNEQKLRAQADYDAKQADLNKANADLAAAQQAVQKALADQSGYQGEVDQFTDESFVSGAQFAKLSTLLSGTSTQDFLDRSSALAVLADGKNKVLRGYLDASGAAAAAQQQTNDAKNRAQAASDAARQLLNDLNARSADLQKQIDEINQVRTRLSAADRAAQRDTGGAAPGLPAPTQAAQSAINAALSRLGDPYVYGATGPNTFDCSGLMLWSYNQAGTTLPRTAAQQQQNGVAVLLSQIQPGDLLFEGSPAYHVAMYLGNGKMVQAPDTGDVVKISSVPNNISNARRVAT